MNAHAKPRVALHVLTSYSDQQSATLNQLTGKVLKMRLLRLKWTQSKGLFVLPHDELTDQGHRPVPFHICGRNLCDVDRFIFVTEGVLDDWPRMSVFGWRYQVKAALIDLEIYDSEFGACTTYTKAAVALVAMDLLDGTLSIEDACLRLHRARALL